MGKSKEFRSPSFIIPPEAEAWIQISQGRASIPIICPLCSEPIATEISTTINPTAKASLIRKRAQGAALMAWVSFATCALLGWATGAVWVCFFVFIVLLVVDVIITWRLIKEGHAIYCDVTHYCPDCKARLGVSDGVTACREYDKNLNSKLGGQFQDF